MQSLLDTMLSLRAVTLVRVRDRKRLADLNQLAADTGKQALGALGQDVDHG